MRVTFRILIPILTAGFLAGCSLFEFSEKKSLYDRLGGQAAIVAVVNDLIDNVAADDKINSSFKDTNVPRLKNLVVEQICEASGGPCKYTGRSMERSHRPLKITDAEFDAFVAHLVDVLNKYKVPSAEQGELLAVLGGMRGQIVTK